MQDRNIFMRVTEDHLMEWKGLQDEILQMVEDYSGESGYDYTFDRATAYSTLWSIVMNDMSDMFVLVDYGQLKGFAVVYLESPWMLETQANIYMFYIKPECRKGTVSVRMMKGCCDYFKARNVKYAFSGSTSRVNDRNTQGFERLLERFGFAKLTTNLMKEIT